jgi:hypothetical protein
VTGGDLVDQLRERDLGRRVLIPQTMLRHGEGVFLDDMTLEAAEAALGVPVVPVAVRREIWPRCWSKKIRSGKEPRHAKTVVAIVGRPTWASPCSSITGGKRLSIVEDSRGVPAQALCRMRVGGGNSISSIRRALSRIGRRDFDVLCGNRHSRKTPRRIVW